MEMSKLFLSFVICQVLFFFPVPMQGVRGNANLFRKYIGSESKNVTFYDVPINPGIQFHFVLAFAIDYDSSSSPSPTSGRFNVFWDSNNLSHSHISSIKNQHSNVKVTLSLGGDTVLENYCADFQPFSVDTWVSNAVSSPTSIIKEYNLDGIDID
ncbi:hypothetical protein SLEP1_g19883 [Rubroshorea leprosula]|uniref:GH18 domain-containing protein n=1 Tax=Rubroshorea leprosula TaxID=152421 RepID=A0AAV5J6R0_9ROSI|nr:hypothetical protein SLEP1_g19883 [Rubroshorea leprosula]